MNRQDWLVITSINAPTPAIAVLASGVEQVGMSFICVGDAKSPANWAIHGCHFMGLEEQLKGSFALSKSLPVGHYSRKNLGYLQAIAQGAQCILETDDDNIPLTSFWEPPQRTVVGRAIAGNGWVNAYAYFTSDTVWPRGFPLEQIKHGVVRDDFSVAGATAVDCCVQQGLANGDTDVDAIYRMTRGELITFEQRAPLILSPGAWCPFNSQNTRWWPQAFDLMYLPSYCSFRMTDIWRSFVVQACLWANGGRVAFMPPSVVQERNPHDLLSDFAAELPGYLNNQRIIETLSALDLAPGDAAVRDNLRRCYARLIEMGLIGDKELRLLDLWFLDLDSCASGRDL